MTNISILLVVAMLGWILWLLNRGGVLSLRRIGKLIIIAVAVVILVGIVGYFVFVKKSEPTAQQSTPTSVASNKTSLFNGVKKTFIPERIASIDSAKKTFVLNLESRKEPFIIPTEFRVIPETVIKKENDILKFDNLSVNDVVWIRAIEEGKDKYLAQHVIITNNLRSSQVIIKRVDTSQNKITAEVFFPSHRRGESTILTIIPETEIRKGKAEEGQNRKVVGIGSLAIGDIATIFEIGFGVRPANDKGPFYTTEIDVVSPYYCEQYLKPPGCIEK